MTKNTALITGGASGLGLEIARVMASDGYNLVLVGRNKEALFKAEIELKAKHQIQVKTIAIDLLDLNSSSTIFKEIDKAGIKADVLVNNAGFGLLGNFAELDLKKQLDIIAVNISALVSLTYFFLKQAPTGAKILNVSSLAAFQPGPLMNVYYASKAFVNSFSEALAKELEKRKIIVTALCPGPINTNFWRVSNGNIEEMPVSSAIACLNPFVVAKAGYRGLKKGHRIVIPGRLNKFLFFLVKILPRSLVLAGVNKLNTRK